MRFALPIFAILAFAFVAHASPPTAAHVRAMLSSYEDGPSPETWRAMGEETLPVLIALYNDAAEPPYVRMRAVATSALFPSPATRTFLRAVAHADGQNDLMIREAVLALGRAFGADALPDVRPYLAHPESTVREGAAIAISRMDGAAARDALRAQLERERNATVRATITRVLR